MWPVDSRHKGLVTQKPFPFYDVIMSTPGDAGTSAVTGPLGIPRTLKIKLKVRESLLFQSCVIVLNFCIEFDSYTTDVFYAKF